MAERSDRGNERTPDDSTERAVYVISVAAELAGMHPQTLRIYERKGLVRPQRTSGNTRRYSDRDIALLQQIHEMTRERGINLAGVKRIIELQAQLVAMRRKTEELEQRLRASRAAAERAREQRSTGGEILPLDSIVLPPWETRSP